MPASPPPQASSSPASHIQCELLAEKSTGTVLTPVNTHQPISKALITAQANNDIRLRPVATAQAKRSATTTAGTASTQSSICSGCPATADRTAVLTVVCRDDERHNQERECCPDAGHQGHKGGGRPPSPARLWSPTAPCLIDHLDGSPPAATELGHRPECQGPRQAESVFSVRTHPPNPQRFPSRQDPGLGDCRV